MHDRRIDGTTHKFGNEGALFKNAMTWWDWETDSIWSQPWGAAIEGPLTGTRLTLIPFELVPWESWQARHPQTKVLIEERFEHKYAGQIPIDDFVIGVSIGADAVGYYFSAAAESGLINHTVGAYPVAILADQPSRNVDVFLRKPQARTDSADNRADLPDILTFELVDNSEPAGKKSVRDIETGSIWDIDRGVAISGKLRGTVLQRAPFVTAFDWAWLDFNEHTDWWGDGSVQ